MAKNDLILLDKIIEDYCFKERPSIKADEVFEFFTCEQVLKDYVFTDEELLSGSVDGRNDGGIDEVFIIVNGHLADQIPGAFWPKADATLDVYFITCKHDDSFKMIPVEKMIPTLMDLLDFSKPSDTMKNAYNEKLLGKRELLISTYKKLALTLTRFNIHLIYACRGNTKIEDNIHAKAEQAISICEEAFSNCSVTFEFWGNEILLERYHEHIKTSAELYFEQCINHNGQYVVLVPIFRYYEFLKNENESLNKRLFEANVRDSLGLNAVNSDIRRSLFSKGCADFWWLNNGITLIGSQAYITGKTITISDVQIVNGMQTSVSIFDYCASVLGENKDVTDERLVLIKVIISTDEKINDEIIFATNNQTNVETTALKATDRLQKDIEAILLANEIYYERRTNYYQNQGIPDRIIVTPLAIAAGYISLIYKNPYVASNLKQKFMRNDQKYERVFSREVDLNVWVIIAKLLLKTDEYLSELKEDLPKSTFRIQKNYKHLLLFLTISRLFGTFGFTERNLVAFDTSKYTKEELAETLRDIKEVKTKGTEVKKKLPAEYYTACFQHATQKYGIKAKRVIQEKNKQFWSDEAVIHDMHLSEEVLQQVKEALPEYPWPTGMSNKLAKELNLSTDVVSEAISVLIYTKKIYPQVYGYVFGENDDVICTGDHHGYSLEEARAKLKEQRGYYNRRYGF